MKIKLLLQVRHRALLLILGFIASLIAISSPSQTSFALGTYDNALIADKALQYKDAWGGKACEDSGGPDNNGQCRAFVNCIVKMVSGGQQSLVNGTNAFDGFINGGGIEVSQENAVKGDILQWYHSENDLHTAIVLSYVDKVSDGRPRFEVVDSNWNGNEVVTVHTDYFPADTRVFRMGTVLTSASASGHINDDPYSDIVLTTANPNGSTSAMVLLSRDGVAFKAPLLGWNSSAFGWSGLTPIVGDFTGDGYDDYAFMTNEGANGVKLWVAASNKLGGFNAHQLWWTGYGYGYGGIKVRSGHINDDPYSDIVLTTANPNGSTSAMVLLSRDGVAFKAPLLGWNSSAFGWSGLTPIVGDFTGDGYDDYAFMTNEGANGVKLWVAASNKLGGFNAHQLWWTGYGYGYGGIKVSS